MLPSGVAMPTVRPKPSADVVVTRPFGDVTDAGVPVRASKVRFSTWLSAFLTLPTNRPFAM